MKTYKLFKEEIGSVVGTGNIAGAGVGPQGEPGVPAGVTSSKRKSDFPKSPKSPVMSMFKRKPPKITG